MLNGNRLFTNLPLTLRDELIECYKEISRNFTEYRWEPAELNGGKFCEIIYTILDGYLSGSFAATASKPPRMFDACRALESRPANLVAVGDRSVRILIPRLLPFLYEIRNNRGVGHVGGEVNPNHADAQAVMSMASWVLAELVRIFHGVSLAEAQAAVDMLVERHHPLVWNFEGTKRVLDPKISKTNQVLTLLYSETNWTGVNTLFGWVEYSNLSLFKSRVLSGLHKKRLLEFQKVEQRVKITPVGIKHVEEKLL